MMLRRPPDNRIGRQGGHQKILVAALAAIFLASCITLAEAQNSHISRVLEEAQTIDNRGESWGAEATIQHGSIKASGVPEQDIKSSEQVENPVRDAADVDGDRKKNKLTQNQLPNDKKNRPIIPHDASALATLAPAQPFRARSPRLRPSVSSAAGAGLASPQSARSLGDWEVEDYVLVATVDGHLYASGRKTGQKRWEVESEPMVTTIHHRANASMNDKDFHPVDQYIWAIEPTKDGTIFMWAPGVDGPVVTNTGLTIKKLVEDLAPHASTDPPVAYLGEKKTSIMTLDAATGNILQFFSTSGTEVNTPPSCVRRDSAIAHDVDECGSIGTITLGRTEYTVAIQRRDSKPLATLKYSEWSLNTFDVDLLEQYKKPMDGWYLSGTYDGLAMAFSDGERGAGFRPNLKFKFNTPVAKVFDVYRQRSDGDAASESEPELVIMPQPPPPVNANGANDRGVVYLNQTEGGSWYALSVEQYPLMAHAPASLIEHPEFWDFRQGLVAGPSNDAIRYLKGIHHLNGIEQAYRPPTLPSAGVPTLEGDEKGMNESWVDAGHDGSLVSRVHTLIPAYLLDRAKALVQNEILIVLIMVFAISHFGTIKQWFRRLSVQYFDPHWIGQDRTILEDGSETEEETKTVGEVQHAEDTTVSRPVEVGLEMPQGQLPSTPPGGQLPHDEGIGAGTSKQTEPAALPSPPVTPKQSEDGTVEDSRVESAEAPSSTHLPLKTLHDSDVLLPGHPVVADVATDEAVEASAIAVAAGAGGDDEPLPRSPPLSADGDTYNPAPKKKKAHRGRRGGQKHKKKNAAAKHERENSTSRDDDAGVPTVDEVVKGVQNLQTVAENHKLMTDVHTIPGSVQSVTEGMIRVGDIEVDENQQLGTGSNGTIVFAGKFDGRVVAVKRMLIQFYDIASRETRLLRESDTHPNVIRYYAQQSMGGFLYIALERCVASLADVVERPQAYPTFVAAGTKDKPNILLQITNGISYLHSLRIVHRDLKPQNILCKLDMHGKPRMVVSDFGLCKKLDGGQSSFGATTGRAAGTSGWRAPELLLDDDSSSVGASNNSSSGAVLVDDGSSPHRRATRSIDIFSLGLVYFYVLTSGQHPYDCGGRYMREVNIRKGNYSLEPLQVLGDYAFEATKIIESMLTRIPKDRPSARDCMMHPFFWDARSRLNFLCDVSDYFEKECRDPPSPALQELESWSGEVIPSGDFLAELPQAFIDCLGKQRKYTGNRMLDLLRALRNKKNHYEDLSDGLKKQVGPLPEGYLAFWTVRFPVLLMACWHVVYDCGWEEVDRFKSFYEPVQLVM